MKEHLERLEKDFKYLYGYNTELIMECAVKNEKASKYLRQCVDLEIELKEERNKTRFWKFLSILSATGTIICLTLLL
jgi:hypothetical protein